jgi:alpha-L-rhamnosidase
MKSHPAIFFAAFLIIALGASTSSQGSTPYGLTTEYRENPVGIDAAVPRLSWKLGEKAHRQTGYEVEADGISCGKTVGSDQVSVAWPGGDLAEGSRHSWRVRIWNEKGSVSDWSDPATFTVGRKGPWSAKWISRSGENAMAFAKVFSVTDEVVRATLYISSPGFYEAYLNGRRIGDRVLDPSPTQFDKRVLYSTYLLDGVVRQGKNELRLLVGHGWYDVRSTAAWNFNSASWRGNPCVIAELKLEFSDGRVERIVTGSDWRVVSSPVLHDDIREGEVICAHDVNPREFPRKEYASVVSGPCGATLVAQPQPPAKILDEIAPERIIRLNDESWMVVFPHNLAGWMRLRLHGQERGSLITVRYDERVGENFEPLPGSWRLGRKLRTLVPPVKSRCIDEHFRYPSSVQVLPDEPGAFQTDRIICSGGEETYEPRFTYNGFKYVWVRGLKGELRSEDVTGCQVGTDFKTVGTFVCSDPTFNALIKMADRSYRCNFTDGVPTDCPHREKNGWTGDAQVVSEMAQYLYENTSAYEKWIDDLCLAQNDKGDIPAIVPTGGWGFEWGNGPAWDAALTVIPWNLHQYRGDRKIVEKVFPFVQQYIAFTASKADDGNLVSHGLGDWVAPVRKRMAPTGLTSSCYWYQAQRIASLMAEVLGKTGLATMYAEGAERTKNSFNRRYYKGDGVYETGLQCAQAMPLTFGLVPASEVMRVRARLIEACEKTGRWIDFGLLGSKHVYRALSEAGRTDLAYQMIVNPDTPSMVPWISAGYGTLWEDWHDGASRNHVMFADFVAWAFQYLAGIRLAVDEGSCVAIPTGPVAFREIRIEPIPIPQLDFVMAETETPYGRVKSAWRREGNVIRFSFTIPSGSTAKVCLPDGKMHSLKPGNHDFTIMTESNEVVK